VNAIFQGIGKGKWVVDLGSGRGSFDPAPFSFRVLRVDVAPAGGSGKSPFVQADAAALPFRDGSLSAVIANHSLEHFHDLDSALEELGRVLESSGRLFISVPDARTLTDRLYRWIARGGGHVNAFTSAAELAARVEARTRTNLSGIKPLCTSLSFLNRRNWRRPNSRKVILLGGGREGPLLVINALLRLLDRTVKSRLSLYGWALFFGPIPERIDPHPWASVCVRCGSGHSTEGLKRLGSVFFVWRTVRCYSCPVCGAGNILFSDRKYRHLSEPSPVSPGGSAQE
jgi:SAM-dependent methyltransferase